MRKMARKVIKPVTLQHSKQFPIFDVHNFRGYYEKKNNDP